MSRALANLASRYVGRTVRLLDPVRGEHIGTILRVTAQGFRIRMHAAECQHCERRIVLDRGSWIDPEATGDDVIWSETCDAHDTFGAEHEPREGSRVTVTRTDSDVEEYLT